MTDVLDRAHAIAQERYRALNGASDEASLFYAMLGDLGITNAEVNDLCRRRVALALAGPSAGQFIELLVAVWIDGVVMAHAIHLAAAETTL